MAVLELKDLRVIRLKPERLDQKVFLVCRVLQVNQASQAPKVILEMMADLTLA